MAPFDWAKLIALNVNDLEEDPTQAEDIYDELGEVIVCTCRYMSGTCLQPGMVCSIMATSFSIFGNYNVTSVFSIVN